jgi:hypothetical protein
MSQLRWAHVVVRNEPRKRSCLLGRPRNLSIHPEEREGFQKAIEQSETDRRLHLDAEALPVRGGVWRHHQSVIPHLLSDAPLATLSAKTRVGFAFEVLMQTCGQS